MNVAILGASDNPERYSFKAYEMLTRFHHTSFLVNPRLQQINGQKVFSKISELRDQLIHTLTIYVNPEVSSSLEQEIIELRPKRVIFNPGSENRELQKKLESQNIECLQACTLVLLSTHQF